MQMNFESQSFGRRLRTMLSVDFRRMFTMPLLYIMVGTAAVIPVLVLVMTTMMEGTVSVDPVTGAETVMEGFSSVWQSIATVSSESSALSMDLVGMCNINLMYFMAAVLVCLFVGGDFRSGYAKNLFTVRARKSDYVISKTLVGFAGSILLLLAYFAGAMLGGAISGLDFDLGSTGMGSVVMCLLSKTLLMGVFVPIYVLAGSAAKQKMWLSIIISLGVGMLLFMMIPMLTPLDATMMNVVLCLAGGILFSIGLGAVSRKVLANTSLV